MPPYVTLGLAARQALPGSRAAEKDIEIHTRDGRVHLSAFTLRPIRRRDKDAWWFCRRNPAVHGRRAAQPVAERLAASGRQVIQELAERPGMGAVQISALGMIELLKNGSSYHRGALHVGYSSLG